MSCHVIPCSFLAACLVFAGVALWLPGEVASRHQAEPEPEPATSDARLIASECAFFITFRPGDFLRDDLVRAVLQDLPKAIEGELHVPTEAMGRLTVATLRQGTVQIVRTKRPYDSAKLRKSFTESRFGNTRIRFDPKDKDGVSNPRNLGVGEKKAGGKTIYYAGEFKDWTPGWCPIDKTTFITGNVASIQALLETKGKPSADMTAALALGSKHSLVMALDGKRLRTLFRHQREDRERRRPEWKERREERFGDKVVDKTVEKTVEGRIDKVADKTPGGARRAAEGPAARGRDAADDKGKGDDDEFDLLFGSPDGAIVGLPYKPLLGGSFGLVTLDIGKTNNLSAKIDFADRDAADDGETALKTLLYVIGQMARILPTHESEFRGLKPLSDPVRKAFKTAKVERKGTTLSTTVTLTPEAGLAKKVRDGIAEESKKRERIMPDKARFKEKTTTTDKR
jgi:hypothetical protein